MEQPILQASESPLDPIWSLTVSLALKNLDDNLQLKGD